MHARATVSLVIAAVLVVRADARQSPSQATPAPPTFGVRTEAVLVDVNVTDRKGRPVTNLSQADFQVFEDNTPQAILTFDRRAPEPSAPVGRAAAAAGLGPGTGGGKGTSTSTQQGPSITALAFDHLSADSRTLAYQAAQRFLRERQADELAGVDVLTFAEDAKLGTYSADTIVLAQLDSGTPETSRKQSQQYKLSGKLELLPQAKAGNPLFFRTPELSSGNYAVHAVVYDAKGTKASVASTSVTVPAAETAVVGDLFIVARAERLPANDPAAANHPLATSGVLLYPSFGEPISKAKSPELTFALPIVAPGETPTATLQILQGGQKLAEIPLPLDKPGADGRLLQTARLPSAAIPPGTCDFKAVISVGGGKVERSTTVTLVP